VKQTFFISALACLLVFLGTAPEPAIAQPEGSPGSLFNSSAPLADLTRDLRAARVGDVVTILVAERASAAAKGSSKSNRSSNAAATIGPLAGISRKPLSSLANLSGEQAMAGEGATTRETVLTTTLTARVKQVLEGGALLVEGSKTVQINSELQTVTVRGVVRPNDLNPGNVVSSERVADLEVRINGKGLVGDAVRRPFFLYRLLLGLLPF